MVSACSRDGSHGKVKIEETDGSSCGQKSTTSLSLFMEANGREVEEELSTMATQLSFGQKEFGVENGVTSKKKLGCGRFEKFRRGSK